MNVELLVTIVTSAAVGAFISALVTALSQAFERKARRRELLLAKAIDITHERLRFVKELAEKTGSKVAFPDPATLAAGYFQALDHLLDKGTLPKGFESEAKTSMDEVVARLKGS